MGQNQEGLFCLGQHIGLYLGIALDDEWHAEGKLIEPSLSMGPAQSPVCQLVVQFDLPASWLCAMFPPKVKFRRWRESSLHCLETQLGI